MKRTLLLTLVMLVGASLAFGQAGRIGVYADPGGTDCSIDDLVPGLLQVYTVHSLHSGAIATQFAHPIPACAIGLTFLGTTYPAGFLPIGNVFTGIILGYGGCQVAPTLLASSNFFGSGLTTLCCAWPVLPDPGIPSGLIEGSDCTGALTFPTGDLLNGINIVEGVCDCIVATTKSTWGGVKALYSDE